MAITQIIATLPAVLNDSETFYEDIAIRNNSLVTTVLPSINAWATQANSLALEIQAKAENAFNAISLDTIEDLATYAGTGLCIVKDLNRGGTFVSKTEIDIDPNTGSLYTINDGTVFTKLGGGFWVRQFSGDLNVKWFGAVGDGLTNNIAVFTHLETLPEQTFFIPNGIFITDHSVLTKNYYGTGTLKHTNLSNNGRNSSELKAKIIDGMNKPNTPEGVMPRSLVFVGDSITYGYGITEAQSYPTLLAELLNRNGKGLQASLISGASTLQRGTVSGTAVTAGTAGPIKKSIIMAVGSVITFTVTDADQIGFWFQRAVGAGSITILAEGVASSPISCDGEAGNDIFSFIKTDRTVGANTVSLTCSVASVEITGVWFSHLLAPGQISISNQSQSGYATSDFTSVAVTTSIGAQTVYSGASYPCYVLALGTNDIYSSSAAVSSETFKANLETICIALRYYGIPILTVPLRAIETTYTTVLEPFDNYRDAVYELSRKYGYKVVDLSELDINGVGGYQADGLHPNSLGNRILASAYFEELGLSSIAYAKHKGTLNPLSPYTNFGGTYSAPSFSMSADGIVSLSGFLNTNGATKNTSIVTLPPGVSPARRKLFTVSGLNGAVGTTATIQIYPDGGINMYDYPLAAITHISLEGVSFNIHS